MKFLILVTMLISSNAFSNDHQGKKHQGKNVPEAVRNAIESCRKEHLLSSFQKGEKPSSESIAKMKACVKSRLPKKQ